MAESRRDDDTHSVNDQRHDDDTIGTAEHRNLQRTHPSVLRGFASCLVFIVGFCLLFALSYVVISAVQQVTGAWPGWVEHVATGMCGIAFFAVIVGIVRHLYRASYTGQRQFAQDILDALNRIAVGDFSVRIDEDPSGPLHEVTQSVNRMAQDLGTLEAQRQEFVSSVSHEIQSPLTSIMGFVGLLEDDGLAPDERRHYLGIIKAECQRLSRLSDNLIKLMMLDDDESLTLVSYDLEAQLQSAVLVLEPQWLDKRLEIQLETEPLQIRADAELLMQVWLNLLQNAIKFTSEGGIVTLRARRDGVHILVDVLDTGIGIASSDLPHIFERFYKADRARDRSHGGSGLGLAIAKRIVELHQGHITVSSELGDGTVFSVCLPV